MSYEISCPKCGHKGKVDIFAVKIKCEKCGLKIKRICNDSGCYLKVE